MPAFEQEAGPRTEATSSLASNIDQMLDQLTTSVNLFELPALDYGCLAMDQPARPDGKAFREQC